MPVVTKNLSIAPRFSPYDFFIAVQVQHSYNSSTNGRILRTHFLTLSATEKKTQMLLIAFTRIELTTSALVGVRCYLLRAGPGKIPYSWYLIDQLLPNFSSSDLRFYLFFGMISSFCCFLAQYLDCMCRPFRVCPFLFLFIFYTGCFHFSNMIFSIIMDEFSAVIIFYMHSAHGVNISAQSSENWVVGDGFVVLPFATLKSQIMPRV